LNIECSYIRRVTTYFNKAGPQNTDETLKLAKERAKELNIKNIVVASVSGSTGVKASEIFKGFNVVIVSHFTGLREPGLQELSEENRRKIEANGAKILTCTHAFMNVERAIRDKFNTIYPIEIIAETLKIFGHGVKVAIEITIMAMDAGLIPHTEDVIAIAGRRSGADTALVIRPVNSTRFFDLIVKEIIAKPREW